MKNLWEKLNAGEQVYIDFPYEQMMFRQGQKTSGFWGRVQRYFRRHPDSTYKKFYGKDEEHPIAWNDRMLYDAISTSGGGYAGGREITKAEYERGKPRDLTKLNDIDKIRAAL